MNVQFWRKIGRKIDEKAECTREYMSILKRFFVQYNPKMSVRWKAVNSYKLTTKKLKDLLMNIKRKTFSFGKHIVTLETGRIAKQTTASVFISMGDTLLLVTVVGKETAVEGQDFFPLTVNYQEKTAAAGKIPGGYFKREGKPAESETLISRLIDRPIRPLFPKGFFNEVQIIATVFSLDPQIQADIPAMLGASAALAISGIPFDGPIGAARVGYVDGQYVLNPAPSELENSQLDLVVAGTKEAVLMVESEAKMLPEEVMLGAVVFGHEQMQTAISAIEAFAKEAGKPAWNWKPLDANAALDQKLKALAYAKLNDAYGMTEKLVRHEKINAVHAEVVKTLCNETEGAPTEDKVHKLLHDMEAEIVRGKILKSEKRIDGRDNKTVRPITIEVGILPRAHGSALFTRGETQAIVTTTLGTEREAQMIDALSGEYRDSYMLHYNFPPFCVGETGMLGSPKRREIGHGKLAKRATAAIIPSQEAFPYTVRVVSEITESNGSSSMATVCGTTLALMDAGVPIKAPVAGIAMGLIKEGNDFAVLTDILGDEDHLGDMDFKVAGTKEGVTALQMDIKINGITQEIMEKALAQAKEGRLHILGIMEQVINKPRETVSPFAPRITIIKIHPDKIRDVIGKGGATIRELTEQTHCSIDIADDGTIKIAAVNIEDSAEAQRRIEEITAEPEVGGIYEGPIVKLADFGAFVRILPNIEGMVHISQIREGHVNNIRDELQEGQIVRVRIAEIDRTGRIRLTMKNV